MCRVAGNLNAATELILGVVDRPKGRTDDEAAQAERRREGDPPTTNHAALFFQARIRAAQRLR